MRTVGLSTTDAQLQRGPRRDIFGLELIYWRNIRRVNAYIAFDSYSWNVNDLFGGARIEIGLQRYTRLYSGSWKIVYGVGSATGPFRIESMLQNFSPASTRTVT